MSGSLVLLLVIGAMMVAALAAGVLATREAEKLAPHDAAVGRSTAAGIISGGLAGLLLWSITDQVGWTLAIVLGLVAGYVVGRVRAEGRT